MSVDALTSSLAALQDVLDCMPAVRAMQIRLDGYADGVLRITAPLAANVNDKGNAFGGSLASVLTLSGWALVSLRLAWLATMPRSTWPTATCATWRRSTRTCMPTPKRPKPPAGMPS